MISNRIRLINTTVSKRPMLDTRCSILDQTQTDRASGMENAAPLLLGPGMKLSMHSFQFLLINMCIDLSGRNIGVPEHFLDDPKIGAVPQQMRREAVPQKMWVNVLFQSGTSCMFLHDLPDTRCCQFGAALGKKNF